MICPTIWRVALLIGGVALAGAPARAQLALPGAAPAAPPGASSKPAKPKKTKRATADASGETPGSSALKTAPGIDSIDGRPLMLNGAKGLIEVSGRGDTLQIDRLSLAGEGVTDASQRCVVNIVGQKPIVANAAGRPDGLARYEVDVPACPFAFDLAAGAVLVPPQITACVFKAADCQTSPSGLWGPDGAALTADAAAIAKRRNEAENAMARALHKLEEMARDKPEAASLVRDQSAFPGERDDTCRDYLKEPEHGFCAATVTATRAALLEARLEAISPSGAKADKSATAEKPKHKKAKAKPAEAGDATPQNPQ